MSRLPAPPLAWPSAATSSRFARRSASCRRSSIAIASSPATCSKRPRRQRKRPANRARTSSPLTGLLNRRALDDALAGEVERAKRFDTDLGLVLIDLDNFKAVNDTHSHAQGDVVLRDVARVLRDLSCELDHIGRYGSEEFAVILPGSDLKEASNRTEDIRKQIAQLRIPRLDRQGTLRVAASYGAASARGATADANALFNEANRHRPDDGPDGGVREPRRPEPDRGAGGAALRPPGASHAPDDPNPPDVR